MKTLLSTIFLLVMAHLLATQPALAQEADIKAIKALIERETASSLKGDGKAMADCWANVPEAALIYIVPDGKGTVSYTPRMPTTIKSMMINKKPSQDTFKNSNYQIRVNGNAAFAQFEQVETAPNGEKGYVHETRYLEKIRGSDGVSAWKIIHVGAWFYKATK